MAQIMYKCPFCDAPSWRTRMMLWKHMHECIQKTSQYSPKVGVPAVGISKEELAATAVTNQ